MRSYLTPGWLLAYAVGLALWALIWGPTPSIVIGIVSVAIAAGIIGLGNLIASGHAVPPEDRR